MVEVFYDPLFAALETVGVGVPPGVFSVLFALDLLASFQFLFLHLAILSVAFAFCFASVIYRSKSHSGLQEGRSDSQGGSLYLDFQRSPKLV